MKLVRQDVLILQLRVYADLHFEFINGAFVEHPIECSVPLLLDELDGVDLA